MLTDAELDELERLQRSWVHFPTWNEAHEMGIGFGRVLRELRSARAMIGEMRGRLEAALKRTDAVLAYTSAFVDHVTLNAAPDVLSGALAAAGDAHESACAKLDQPTCRDETPQLGNNSAPPDATNVERGLGLNQRVSEEGDLRE